MTKARNLKCATIAAATFALVSARPSAGAAQTTHEQQHPAGAAVEQAAPPAPADSGMDDMSGMMDGGMMAGPRESGGMTHGMPMGHMMRMMQMMSRGGAGASVAAMCAPDMAGMRAADHTEGRIAFLRAELQITEAQTPAWNAFAEALRGNVKELAKGRASTMEATPTAGQRLDSEEQRLAARLDGVRRIKPVFVKLYDSLSAEQKKTADELLAPNVGAGTGTMMPMGGHAMPTGKKPQ